MEVLRPKEELTLMYDEAVRVLESCGYTGITVSSISLNSNFRKALGRYHGSTKSIEINSGHFLYDDHDEVIGTIIHEIIHNLSFDDCIALLDYYGPGNSRSSIMHAGRWKEIADDVSKKTKFKITRFSTAKGLTYGIPQYEHLMVCPKCGCGETVISKYEAPHRKKYCFWCEKKSNEKVVMQYVETKRAA